MMLFLGASSVIGPAFGPTRGAPDRSAVVVMDSSACRGSQAQRATRKAVRRRSCRLLRCTERPNAWHLDNQRCAVRRIGDDDRLVASLVGDANGRTR